MDVGVTEVCTDSVHLALTALMMNPNCPLHRLSDEERVWTIKFVTLLWGHEKEPYVAIAFNVSEQATTMDIGMFHFVFEELTSEGRMVSALSVVGICAYINEHPSTNLPASFDALVNHIRTHPTIRALVLLFDSFDRLVQESITPCLEGLVLVTETIQLHVVLAYESEEEHSKAIGVYLVTLEPNGCIWSDLLGRKKDKSSEILQRQLRKNKQTS